MKQLIINLMVFAGSVMMAYNIYLYMRFSASIRRRGNWDEERRLLRIPIVLLILFLAGYVFVGVFGHPDLVIAGILLGGSLFVLVMVLMIRRTVDRIQEIERLEAKLLAAEEASRAKSFFLSNMSHDIRTPLNAITGYTTLAKGEDVPVSQKDEYILKIEKAGHQLLDIVNDVLEMSRIESGRMELEPKRIDLEECIREAGDLVKTQLEGKQIRFTVGCSTQHRWVLCDREQLNRALMNLLCNAGKFTGENGSISLTLEEQPGDGETGNYQIRVKDTGIGMSPEFVENLFTPFERERTSTISRIQGTGLGMAITKNIVDLMGGTIDVMTEKGKGTEFIISVSFPIEEEPVQTGSGMAGDVGQARFDGVRVLLVEDNPVNMEIAQMLLTQAGFQVETALNGKEAVDRIAGSGTGYYDVVLMDIQMPVMNGYEAAAAIRSLPDSQLAAMPIIAMTANAFQDDIRMAQEAGMNGHIAKPVDVETMMKTLQEVLQGSGQQGEAFSGN